MNFTPADSIVDRLTTRSSHTYRQITCPRPNTCTVDTRSFFPFEEECRGHTGGRLDPSSCHHKHVHYLPRRDELDSLGFDRSNPISCLLFFRFFLAVLQACTGGSPSQVRGAVHGTVHGRPDVQEVRRTINTVRTGQTIVSRPHRCLNHFFPARGKCCPHENGRRDIGFFRRNTIPLFS